MGKWKDRMTEFQQWMSDDKHIRVAVMIGLALVLLLFLWGLFPKKEETVELVNTDQDILLYQQQLEQKTELLLQKIDGVGKLSVMITLDGDYEVVYQTNDSKKSERTENGQSNDEDITVAQAGDQALIRTSKLPTVLGVAVVCQGGDEAIVQKRVTDTVTTLFSISSARVSVVAGTENE